MTGAVAGLWARLRHDGLAFLAGGVPGPVWGPLPAPRIGGLPATLLWSAARRNLPAEAGWPARAAMAAAARAVVPLAEAALALAPGAFGPGAGRAPHPAMALPPLACLVAPPLLPRRGQAG